MWCALGLGFRSHDEVLWEAWRGGVSPFRNSGRRRRKGQFSLSLSLSHTHTHTLPTYYEGVAVDSVWATSLSKLGDLGSDLLVDKERVRGDGGWGREFYASELISISSSLPSRY
uniref:Uncharacterized protein n=1 Tax=Physcomitrium patens TaxID=3218 RepID=A0A2K1JTA4_PHYPA|nr:hypothetical protein PHYPA_014539 [Physcomitrium patens]